MSRFRTVLEEIEIVRKNPVQKHGTHDQKTHGNWATGGTTITSLIDKLSEKRTPGFSIDLRTKTSPKSGFIASDKGAERRHKWSTVSRDRDTLRTTLKSYIKDHADLLDGSGAFFGAWIEKGTLYLDVSRRYPTRSEGIAAGFRNSQKSIYDVEKDSYIYMKDEVDERTEKARNDGNPEARQGDDGSRVGRFYGRDSGSNRGQSLNPHVCLGRYTVVQKHLEGQHDQRTHGNWAGDRYPEDSVKSARDGALEYSFKKGLKHDETIDYKKVVANRERASKIADIYEDLPKMDRDAVDEYEALATEVEEQFDFMTKTLGVKVEFVADDPYKTSKEMFDDVSRGTLKVLQTESTGAHPLFSDAQNNKFRAVHDYFGHAATGRGFGQDGEEAAWVHHSQMFTQKARGALTTETRGQNSFFNNRGKQFADQKVALLPEEYWKVPATFSKRVEILFEAGLIPIIKHLPGQHDQQAHGAWAEGGTKPHGGFTEEEADRIASWENRGPTIEQIGSVQGMGMDIDSLKQRVMNDPDLYNEATEGIEEKVEARLNEIFTRWTENERNEVFEEVQDEMIDEYAEANKTYFEAIASDSSSLKEGFDEVFGVVANTEYGRMFSRVNEVDVRYDDGKDALVVSGSVLLGEEPDFDDPNWQDNAPTSVGEFERHFYQRNGEWIVEHKWFRIDDEYQGTGFGKTFLQQSKDYYTAKGFKYIYLEAGLEDGARHWARAGFDWDNQSRNFNISQLNNVSQWFLLGGIDGEDADRIEWTGLVTKMQTLSPKDSDYPTPADFAMVGYSRRKEDSSGETMWAGKRVMENMRLNYMMPLTAEGQNLLAGPIDRDGDGLVYDGTSRERPAPQQ